MPKPIQDLSDQALLEEYYLWDQKIKNSKSWGAALAAANEFRNECKREIDKRNFNLSKEE